MFLVSASAAALLSFSALVLLSYGTGNAEDERTTTNGSHTQTRFQQSKPALALFDASIDDLTQALNHERLTSMELINAYTDRIRAAAHLNSIIELNPLASSQASIADTERRRVLHQNGTLPILHGIPILVKDNIATEPALGSTTAGSYALLGSVTRGDSTVVQKLREHGAIILGKTNMDEFAKAREGGAWGWSARGGQMQNPFYPNGSTSGSSGGSAIATSLGLAAASLGTQTGVSIVVPADRHGIIGLKPTRGLTSRYGVIPVSENLDSVGPMTRYVRDAAILLNALAGRDKNDPWSLQQPIDVPDYTSKLRLDALQGVRLGIPWNAAFGVHPQITKAIKNTIRVFEQLGAIVVNSDFDEAALRTVNDTANFERLLIGVHDFKINLEDYLQNYQLWSPVNTLHDIIEWNNKHPELELPPSHDQLWSYASNATDGQQNSTYLQAVSGIEKVYHSFLLHTLEKYNLSALIMPTNVFSSALAAMAGSPMIAVPLGFFDETVEPERERNKGDEWAPLYPAPNIPFGFSFLGRRWDEQNLLGYAFAFEQFTDFRSAARERLRVDVRGWA